MKNEIQFVIDSRAKDIGIPVRRILPWMKKRMVGPFIFLDHMGPVLLKAPNDHVDVRPHPHIGLSTLTYLFEGSLLHRDSLGVTQLILPGEVNWMTAGKGISHSERESTEARKNDRMIHGLQFWVALPKADEDVEPSFHHYEKSDIPEFKTESLEINLVAGSAFGHTSKLKAYSPLIFMVMRGFKAGSFSFEEKGHEHALYVVKGEITLNGTTYKEGQMVVMQEDSAIELEHSKDALFVLIGGEVFPGPRYIWWNLVSSSKEKIEQAKKAWREGTFPMVPGDDEKIPLPDEPTVPNYP